MRADHTIAITLETKKKLMLLKKWDRETYDDVINRLMAGVTFFDKDGQEIKRGDKDKKTARVAFADEEGTRVITLEGLGELMKKKNKNFGDLGEMLKDETKSTTLLSGEKKKKTKKK